LRLLVDSYDDGLSCISNVKLLSSRQFAFVYPTFDAFAKLDHDAEARAAINRAVDNVA
jgi:hypothetical protein